MTAVSTSDQRPEGWRGKIPAPVKQLAWRIKDWVGIRYNRVEAFLYDVRHGTDTGGKTAAANLDIPAETVEHVTGFQSVNERHLQTVLEAIDFPIGSVFIDIGCGKGKALLIAAQLATIDKVMGIELAESLCKASEKNMEIARARGLLRAPSKIIHGDAVEAEYDPSINIFFLNNPFDAAFMIRMIDVLQRHAQRNQRKVWMLYGNPQHASVIEQDGRLKLVRAFKFFGAGRDITVYEL
jgi:SAM-dependent methyltransferase